jgi:hypothetical protein
VASAAFELSARFIFFGRFAARLEVVPFPVVLDARREDGVDEFHRSLRQAQGRLFVGSRPLRGRLRCLRMAPGSAGEDPMGFARVESHFSQSTREMGHLPPLLCFYAGPEGLLQPSVCACFVPEVHDRGLGFELPELLFDLSMQQVAR